MHALEECKSTSKSISISNDPSSTDSIPIYEPLVQRKRHRKRASSRFSRIAKPYILNNENNNNSLTIHNNFNNSLHSNSTSNSTSNSNSNKPMAPIKKIKRIRPTPIKKIKKIQPNSVPPITPLKNIKNSNTNANKWRSVPPITPLILNKNRLQKRRIKPSLISISLNKTELAKYLNIRENWILLNPNKRKIKPYLISSKKGLKIIEPELIGTVSNESLNRRDNLNKYFNIQNNKMFNENNFSKYTFHENSNNNSNATFQYYEYVNIIINDKSAPVNSFNTTNSLILKEKSDSDISISSNPDDPLVTDLYRRKMIKSNTNKKKEKTKNKTKITDYFLPMNLK